MTQQWKKSPWLTVNYMSWAKFVEGVGKVGDDILPEASVGYDLIWGGVDLNLNIR